MLVQVAVEYNKLFTAIKANNEPDLSQVEFQTLPQFETTGSLVDLSQYGANSVKNQFPVLDVESGQSRQWGVCYPTGWRSYGLVLPGRYLQEV